VLAAAGSLLLLVLVLALRTTGGEPESTRPARLAGLIVFWRETPWPSLWSVRPDGSGLRRIYVTRQNAKRPRLSPNGEWIAFDGASPGKRPLSDFDVQIVRVDGLDRRTLAGTPEYELDAQWSPDGKRLSYSSYRHTGESDEWLAARIWTVTAKGGNPVPLGLGSNARWSPDGKRLAFSAPTKESDGDLFVMNADGTGRRRLAATPALEQTAGWSPDGSKILFTQLNTSGADVMVMDMDGGDVRTLTAAPGFDFAAAWSPDGRTILYTTGRNAAGQLWLMNADGSDARVIAGGRVRGYEPSWG
jgi:Tol biopolymer transport system component